MSFSKKRDQSLNNKDGEYKCQSCNGTGYSDTNDKSSLCSNCYGSGKLTWTEKIVGKKNPYEKIFMPLLRTFYPKSLASSLVSIQPMPEPTIIKHYMKPKVKKND